MRNAKKVEKAEISPPSLPSVPSVKLGPIKKSSKALISGGRVVPLLGTRENVVLEETSWLLAYNAVKFG